MAAGLVLAALAGGLFVWAISYLRRPRRRVQRGRRLVGIREVERRSRQGGSPVTWGGVRLAEGAETGHFLVAGTTGSGKTLILSRLIREALSVSEAGSDTRALVYDAKSDVLAELRRLELRLPVVSLNPFDACGAQWNMAADVTSPASALQVAAILIPEEVASSNRYFSDAARDLLTGAMLSFVAQGAQWTLRDLLLVMRSKDRLGELLWQRTEGRELWDMYSGEARAFQNVLATARSRLAPLEPVAACWSHARSKVSLREWVKGEMVLVLGNDDAARAAVDALNRVLFQRATELALAETNSTTRRTWFFLDELREAGRLDGLSRLLNKGRSRGCCVALGFQDIHGLQAVYGPEVASEIVGQCAQKAFLRLESGETARWAAQQVGQYEEVELMQSESRRGILSREAGRSVSEQRRTADAVMPSEFLCLSATSVRNGLSGYYLSPHVGAWKRTLPLEHFVPSGGGGDEVDGERRSEGEQYLDAWSEAEEWRLGFVRRSRDGRREGTRSGAPE